jgi:hypothetical protein
VPEGEWLRISGDMTQVIDKLSGRDDLIVKIAPDAGYEDSAFDQQGDLVDDAAQESGVTFLESGIVELNGNLIPDGMKLTDVRPLEHGNRKRYPALWGVLSHEAGHGRHTGWLLELKRRSDRGELTRVQQDWAGAALLLEEPRVEAGQIRFRPQDQPWLQAAATEITLRELTEALEDGKNLDKKHVVARMCLLTHGRIDAGSMESTYETDRLEELGRQVFGDDYDKMREIWLEAIDAPDGDPDLMLDLGRRWFELTGDNGGHPTAQQIENAEKVMQALGEMLGEMQKLSGYSSGEASGENGEKRRRDRLAKAVRDNRKESARQKDARKQADKVFHAGPDPDSTAGLDSPVTGYRDPTGQEMSLARSTRRALMTAYSPERAKTLTYADLPPGRLNAARARQAAALREMGFPESISTVRRKERRRVPVPPLKVAIAQDVSGSQNAAAAATVSGAWSLAKAAEGIMDAQLAMVTFGDAVHAVIGPRDRVPRVPELETPSGSHHLHEALEALEGELGLMRTGFARLLVILTDGIHEKGQIDARKADLTRLLRSGVKILWFVTDGSDSWRKYTPDIRGLRVHHESRGKYEVIPRLICTEAVGALKY